MAASHKKKLYRHRTGIPEGAIRTREMKLYWRITLASAIAILPVDLIHADINIRKFEESQMSKQETRIVQRDASSKNAESKVAAQNNKKTEAKTPAKEAEKKSTGYFQPSSSYGTQPESDPPRYVRNLSKTGIEAFKDITWLDIGFQHRTRYEFRSNDIRRTDLTLDQPFLLRSRAYAGIREILDPFRGAVEFQDSRRYNGNFPHDDRDFNDYELIQAYGELYFKGALGEDDRKQQRPLRFRVGRMAYEALDRRLIGRNEWRNTTNTFEGFRINLGQEVNDWEVDLWAYQPVRRLLSDFDERIENQWFYGAIGHWRKWSDFITLQPHYMALTQDGSKTGQIDRHIHSPALRGYGKIGDTGLDYDFNLIYQFGRNGTQDHDAHAYTTEVGYTARHSWKPRISAFYGYATGDRDPDDNVNNRFERFFGFSRPWSADDYIIFENIKAPKVKLEFQPAKDLRIDAGYNLFWLASDRDRFNNLFGGNGANGGNANRDPTGNSGDFIGHAFDIRARYKLGKHIDTTVGYSHFTTGEFTRNRQVATLGRSPGSSDFFYVEVMISAF
ncbi:alginate export family protein [Nitrosovibrio sp. Nv4]|uniref:alginate export family protein n=1 Tax=Nitrosovibrio sp. Nv4 TaxID=1945880 RepID=UPI000BCD0389|nr:alginate export family protein [Nitrosovibrio sp. Nv4]SOD40707.1 Alginate export [Nitrosovibrio sp. Nv4]